MNRKLTYTIILVIVTVGLYYLEKRVDKNNEDYPVEVNTEKNNSLEFDVSLIPSSSSGAIIEHSFFTLSYVENHEQAEWVAYLLAEDHISKNEFDRPYFIEDRKVKTKSADWRNYKNSGYDRGHLCPAGDRTFSYDAYHETFLTSNISPQNHEFNAGIWNRLEQKTRFWAKKYNDVYVITGGVLEKELSTIGDEKVSVPNEFYKIIVDASDGKYKAISFLIPNQASSKSIYEYAVSIDEIEHKTGIDFFPKLSDQIETQLESEINLKAWGKR